MLDYNTALEMIVSAARPLQHETVELRYSLNRVLAEDVYYDTDMPPFNKAAVDGYACKRADVDNHLEIIETIFAGKLPEKKLQRNQCYKIMTGAVVPQDADCIFMNEDSVAVGTHKVLCKNPPSGSNICYQGEDIKSGTRIMDKSVWITPRHLPLLAGAGIVAPYVYKRPEVTVMATGTELVEPDAKPLSFQIRNSNSSQLLAQLAEINIQAHYSGIVKDSEPLLSKKIDKAFENSQIVILTGGVSVGDFDLIPGVLTKLGYDILISSTAIQPGKPMVFAQKGEKYCFGLSGNPVSSFVQFVLYVKPFILALMGHSVKSARLRFPIGKEVYRKNAGRLKFIPSVLTSDLEVMPVEFHGSAHINALAEATYLIEIPRGVQLIKKGELVNVRSL